MIKRLILSRFRGIRKGVLKDIGDVNLLVGPNNSGKTAILEAIYWLSMSNRKCRLFSDFPDVLPEKGLNASVPSERDLLGLLPCPRIWKRHGKHDVNENPPYSWRKPPCFVTEDGTLVYKIPHLKKDEPLKSFRLIPPPSEEIADVKRFEKTDSKTTGLFALDNPEGIDDVLKQYLPGLYPDAFWYGVETFVITSEGVFSSEEEKMYRFAFTWFPDFIYGGKSLGTWAVEGKPANDDCVLFFDFHSTADHFTESFYRTISDIPDWRKKLTTAFGSVFEGKFTANIEPHPILKDVMQGTIEPEGMKKIPVDDLGDGARHAFKVLAALIVLADRCKDGHEGVFLWEDPELFMHPKSLRALLVQVMDIVQDKPIQVFISTQSLEVLALFAKILKERPGLQDKSRVFRLDLRDGELLTACSTYSKLMGWLESGLDPRFWSQMETILSYQLEAEFLEDVDE